MPCTVTRGRPSGVKPVTCALKVGGVFAPIIGCENCVVAGIFCKVCGACRFALGGVICTIWISICAKRGALLCAGFVGSNVTGAGVSVAFWMACCAVWTTGVVGVVCTDVDAFKILVAAVTGNVCVGCNVWAIFRFALAGNNVCVVTVGGGVGEVSGVAVTFGVVENVWFNKLSCGFDDVWIAGVVEFSWFAKLVVAVTLGVVLCRVICKAGFKVAFWRRVSCTIMLGCKAFCPSVFNAGEGSAVVKLCAMMFAWLGGTAIKRTTSVVVTGRGGAWVILWVLALIFSCKTGGKDCGATFLVWWWCCDGACCCAEVCWLVCGACVVTRFAKFGLVCVWFCVFASLRKVAFLGCRPSWVFGGISIWMFCPTCGWRLPLTLTSILPRSVWILTVLLLEFCDITCPSKRCAVADCCKSLGRLIICTICAPRPCPLLMAPWTGDVMPVLLIAYIMP